MTPDFFGIARERVFSPGKVEDDRAILEAVAAQLSATSRVRLVSADDPLPSVAPATRVFAMCQGPAALATLRSYEASGVRVVNSAAAIESTHRHRLLRAFERHGIAQPAGQLVRTDDPDSLPAWVDGGAWLKRGDVHATEPEDVVRVADRSAARAGLLAMQRRGIAVALVQQHVDGDVFKFYAVRGRFFACFAAADAAGASPGTDGAMQRLAEAGAAAVGLEVFGGDCVRDCQQNLWLIDLNDWPSYARCRFGAAQAIASYLTAQTGTT